MRNYKLLIGIFVMLLLKTGCRFQREIEIFPYYFVIQVDDVNDKDLCYKLYDGNYLGLLDGGLLNLYQRGDTLVAVKAIKKKTRLYKEYYIIPMYNDDTFDPSMGINGPLSKTDLNKELSKKGIEISQFVEVDIE
ncbi:hypothetical protein [Sphingobacterium sp. LRF_L2]|uniref:hypothetical protein n=1 Tax=Sphingobacterium sp. LRF_L2 TaxID=3369421 RepID=UPI003F610CD0